MTLDTALRLGVLIIKSNNIVFKTIISTKSKFTGYTDNVAVTIRDLMIYIRFYIINIPGTRVILRFPFFR